MVSIPDWSKLRGVGEAPREPVKSPSRYQRHLADDAVKQAEEHGYFLTASRSFIAEKYLTTASDEDNKKRAVFFHDEQEKDLSVLRMVKLMKSHLRTIGDIGLCVNLRICTLSNNYITRIDALASCNQLIKLDLHSNQITTLPGPGFWTQMRHLCLLNLHDNPVGQIENVHSLSACPSLLVLTLHDTPLSLKRNYRHHVVNSIWSLRALDKHVISDEEIIEDADFGGQFGALYKSFRVNLCPATDEQATYTDELNGIRRMLATINQVMAHNSPVLIIQRYIRGFLLRKRYKIVQDMRIWAAVTIQRKYRAWKGLETPRVQVPPPPSPATGSRSAPKPITIQMAEALKLDYDTYLKNRRPGSAGLSDRSGQSEAKALPVPLEPQEQEEPEVPPGTPISDEDRRKNHIFINLSKLQTGTLYSMEGEALQLDAGLSSERPTFRDDPRFLREPRKPRKPKPEERKRVVKSVKQFFGPVVETVSTPEPDANEQAASAESDQEVPVVNFRLRGRQQGVRFYDPTTDMIIRKRDAGEKIRAAENTFHRQVTEVPKLPPKVLPSNNEQRMFARVQGTMGLTCLQAIQQAYRDRDKAEKRAAKFEAVLNLKDQRESAKERIRIYHDDKRNKAIREREQDQKRLIDQLEKKEFQRLNSLDKYNDNRTKSSKYKAHQKGELTFVNDFNVQNTSVSNALLRHDRQARTEDKQSEKLDYIQSQKHVEQEQKEIVKKYMEHRQLMRQTESAMSRAAVDTKMLQEANDRLMASKTRVAHQKTMSSNVQAFYPLPSKTNQSLPQISDDTASSVSMKNFEKWSTSRLSRHPTIATM